MGDCLNESCCTKNPRVHLVHGNQNALCTPAGTTPLLGKHNSRVFFYYEPQRVTVLDYAFLATIKEKADGTVIYADRCSIGEDKLAQMGITFKKIPRDISRL